MKTNENKVKISTTNAKLGGKILSVNLPPIATCRSDAPCAKLCYARKGNFTYENVRKSHLNNYNIFKEDSNKYFDDIIEYLTNDDIVYKFMRWHSSGDIIDYKYLLGMVKVAESCPQTKFLAFTKKYELVNIYLDLGKEFPSNLKIVFSLWDKNFKVDNKYNLPITCVNFKNKDLNIDFPEFAIPCVGKCYECKACWSLEKGQAVIFNQH